MSVKNVLGAAALFLGAAALAAPALADRPRDRVEADSFGNLVVWSSAGYKRIVVGKGHLAPELADFVDAGRPKVIYGTDGRDAGKVHGGEGDAVHYRHCYRPPVLLKGRDHMYGLAEGELPVTGGSCHPLAD